MTPTNHFTESILDELTPDQLIYLLSNRRGFVVLPKAKPLISVPPGRAQAKHDSLLKLAKELDYRTVVVTEQDRIKFDHDVLASFQHTVSFGEVDSKYSFFENYYREEDINIVLKLFGADPGNFTLQEDSRTVAKMFLEVFASNNSMIN